MSQIFLWWQDSLSNKGKHRHTMNGTNNLKKKKGLSLLGVWSKLVLKKDRWWNTAFFDIKENKKFGKVTFGFDDKLCSKKDYPHPPQQMYHCRPGKKQKN